MPGVAEYQNIGGQLIPKLPTPDMCGAGPVPAGAGAGATILAVAVLAGIGVGGYFLLR